MHAQCTFHWPLGEDSICPAVCLRKVLEAPHKRWRNDVIKEQWQLCSSRDRRVWLRLCGPSFRFPPVSSVPASFSRPKPPQLLRSQGMRFVHRSDQSCRPSLPDLQTTVRNNARQALPEKGTGPSGVLLKERWGLPLAGRTERPRDSLTEILRPRRRRMSVRMWCVLPATSPQGPRDGRVSTASSRVRNTEPDTETVWEDRSSWQGSSWGPC